MSIRVRKEVSMKIIFDDMDEKELTIRTKCPKNFFLRAKETCIKGYEGKSTARNVGRNLELNWR